MPRPPLRRLLRLIQLGLFGLSAAGAHGTPLVDPASIPAERYLTVRDGQLWSGGERQRFWGLIGTVFVPPDIKPDDSPEVRASKVAAARAATERLLDRLEQHGFNAARVWGGFNTPTDYTPGDGSQADAFGHFVQQAGKRGWRLWTAGLNSVGHATPADVGIIDDPATAEAWQAAVAGEKGGRITLRNHPARIWDPRLQAISLQRMVNVATHLNRHTGLRWCDDPTFGVWELSNEEWWMRRMLTGRWQQIPAFFRNSLAARWQDFLRQKYKDDAGLLRAWGRVLPSESLAAGTILVAPMAGATQPAAAVNDDNPATAEAVRDLPQELKREDFPEARASDILEFLLDLHLAHKRREAAVIKNLGRSTRLSPLVWDTGIGYQIHSMVLHQEADAVTMCAYVNGWGPQPEEAVKRIAEAKTDQQRARLTQEAERIAANVPVGEGKPGGWVNWLRKPPGISQGIPWLEQNRVAGLPYLVYETQIQQPARYRADFPLRLLALGAIQDWDWVNFHYFGDDRFRGRLLSGAEDAFDGRMDVTVSGHPQGYHFTYDHLQLATMRVAGHAFRLGLLSPAPQPTTFIYGRRDLYNPESMSYGGSYGLTGLDMMQTTYEHGVRIRVDPTREDSEVVGPRVGFADRNRHNPYRPTDAITFDWQAGFLRVDDPEFAAWTGQLATAGQTIDLPRAGVRLTDVTFRLDPGVYEPERSAADRYLAFALASTDGQPLAEARRATLTLVSTSFNDDFELYPAPKGLSRSGSAPVRWVRVGATVQAPALDGMAYTFLDASFRPIGQGRVSGGRLVLPDQLPIQAVELRRD